LDAMESLLRDLESKRKVAFTDVQNKRSYIERIKAELKKSEEAMVKVEKNAGAFDLYSQKLAEKEALEMQGREKDGLLLKMSTLNVSVQDTKNKLDECERSLKDIEGHEEDIKNSSLRPRNRTRSRRR